MLENIIKGFCPSERTLLKRKVALIFKCLPLPASILGQSQEEYNIG